jgi:long-chain acyl-CoA synthetase
MNSLPPLAEVFDNRHIVVTGATGYVGKVWTSWMLTHFPNIQQLTLLIRPSKGKSAVERFEEIAAQSPVFRPLRASLGSGFTHFLNSRIQVIEADISQPFSGLHLEDVAHLVGDVDLVLHFAGLTDFNPDPLRALAINTEGPLHMADVAAHIGAPIAHVSTCYVAGRFDGVYPESVPSHRSPSGEIFDAEEETELLRKKLQTPDETGRPPRRQARLDIALARAEELGWPNIYTYTKALGEQRLARRTDVVHTTIRPAIVECARNFPFPGWNEGINTAGPIVALMSTWYRNLPSRAHYHFDVIPVDTVVRGCTLACAATLLGKAAPVYQLATSDHNPYTFAQVVDLNALALKRYLRKNGSSPLQRFHAWTDGINAQWGDTGALPLLRTTTRHVRAALKDLNPKSVPKPIAALLGHDVEGSLQNAIRGCSRTEKKLRRIDELLELYKPFIWDTHWTFRTENIRELSANLCPEDKPDHMFDTPEILWRDYWVNVEYPGLATWCFPLLEGKEVKMDPAPDTPLSLLVHPPKRLEKTA